MPDPFHTAAVEAGYASLPKYVDDHMAELRDQCDPDAGVDSGEVVSALDLEALESAAKAATRLSAHPSSHRSAPYADAIETILSRLQAAEIENEKLQGSLIDENARATTAEALVGELVKALKPFAEVSEKAKGTDDACWCGQDGAVIRYRDLRRAALAYKDRPDTGQRVEVPPLKPDQSEFIAKATQVQPFDPSVVIVGRTAPTEEDRMQSCWNEVGADTGEQSQ